MPERARNRTVLLPGIIKATRRNLLVAAKDWSKIYQKYKGLWVALKDDEETVVGSGATLKEAIEKAKKAAIQTRL
jgi:Family of unknown function (DUF5678)